MKKYQITKKDFTKRLVGLVCHQCGKQVTPLDTVDNSGNPTFWSGCNPCSILDWGVKPEIYKIARMMVVDRHISLGHRFDLPKTEAEREYQEHLNIGSTAHIVQSVLQCQKLILEAQDEGD